MNYNPIELFLAVLSIIVAILTLLYMIKSDKEKKSKSNKVEEGKITKEYQSNHQIKHNLPHREQFNGRSDELSDILTNLRLSPSSNVSLVGITGIGGLGKSSLAIESAYQIIEHSRKDNSYSYDAIIWITAKEQVLESSEINFSDAYQKTLQEIYESVAHILEEKELLRDFSNEEMLFKNLLSNNKVLLIIDNLETIEDQKIKTLLQNIPSPSKALVTSREKNIEKAYNIALQGLTNEACTKLVKRQCEVKNIRLNENQIEKLILACDYVPLTIVWTLSRLAIGYDLDETVEELSCATSLISEYCFKSIIEKVDDKRALNILTAIYLCESPTTKQALFSITAIDKKVYNHYLTMFTKLSLISFQDGRFYILPITRRFIKSEIIPNHTKEEINEFKQRFIDHYLSFLKETIGFEYWSGREFLVDFENYKLGEFLLELDNIVTAIEISIELQDHRSTLNIYISILHILWATDLWQKREFYGKAAVIAAEKLNENTKKGWIYVDSLGFLYLAMGKIIEAETHINTGLEVAREIHNEDLTVLALIFKAQLFLNQLEIDKAKEVLKVAKLHSPSSFIGNRLLRINKWVSEKSGKANILKNLFLRRNINQSNFEENDSKKELKDLLNKCENIFNKIDLLLKRNKISKAEKLIDQVSALEKDIGDLRVIATIRKYVGIIALKKGEIATGKKIATDTKLVFQFMGDQDAILEIDEVLNKTN